MKTTITLPNLYHKELKKIAVDQSKTMAELIWEAVQEKFFKGKKVTEKKSKEEFPFNKLKGLMKAFDTSEIEISDLRQQWKKRLGAL